MIIISYKNSIYFTIFSRSFAPKESTILQTKLYPTRIGVSRLYVTFISDDTTSLTQIIPIEIILEPLKIPDEPILKENKETPIESNEKSEEKEVVPTNTTPDTQEKLENKKEEEEKEEPKVTTKIEEEKTTTVQNEDDDDIDELYLKKKPNYSQSTNSLHPHGSTLSLDKDKMSIDSLDISNDRRPPNQ